MRVEKRVLNVVELNVLPDGSATLILCIQPNFKLNTPATVTGAWSVADRMYLDRKTDESGFCKVLTPASMWPMLAESRVLCKSRRRRRL